MTPADLVLEVGRLASDVETSKAILIAMVRAKRAGKAAPEAWAAAFEVVDRWLEEEGPKARPLAVECPDCEAILPNVDVTIDGIAPDHEPVRIDCGPIHVLHYQAFAAHVGEGQTRIEEYKRGESTITSIGPVLEDTEGDTNADLQG